MAQIYKPDGTAFVDHAGMDLTGTRVLLTGATSGIGWELAHQLVDAGASVFATGRSVERLAELRHITGIDGCVADLSQVPQCANVLQEAVQSLGGVDWVIANAAIQYQQSFTGPWTPADDGRVLEEATVNLASPAALFGVSYSSLAQSGGRFVAMSSGLAYAPKASAPMYCASKAGLSTFLTAVRYQAEDDDCGVTVHEVILPLVATAMTEGRQDGAITAQQAAAEILSGIVAGRSTIAVGRARKLKILLRVAPGVARRMLRNG